ncbi:MAG: DUF6265 family protein [Parasphingopyxis sp.]|nr:DUF6265 family protein [Sphingomonadales bacterium]
MLAKAVCFIAFFLLAATAAPAQDVRSLGEGTSPPATIDQMAWIVGSWAGSGLGGESHEAWLPPVAGQIAGIFHQSRDGALQFYEILQFIERDGSLVLRLKHFNADLSGWEDNTAESALEFPLVAIEEDAAYFSGLTYQRVGEDGLRIHLRLRNEGEDSIATFELNRID